ncbi:MAG: hypothetical protein DRI54_05795, partial [Bacteroidetes bacterium]
PASNEIFISSISALIISEISIYNQLGQQVLHQYGSNNAIDVSTVQPGIYILELVSGSTRVKKKLIIE